MLPDYLIYRNEDKSSSMTIRKMINGEAGIGVENDLHNFPGKAHAEFFINKSDAIELIEALREYFNI